MFKANSKIFKILAYDEAVHTQQNALKEAVYSPIIRVTQGTYHYIDNDLPRHRTVLVIEMKQILSENFFQLSNGGEARLVGWINAETDKERLKRIERALSAGKVAKLTDPQGFYMTEGADPVIFIDLHAGNAENAALDGAIEAVAARRAVVGV